MADRFESGVASYVIGRCEVFNAFPVDAKGNVEISCVMCKFYRVTSRSCSLNNAICEYPTKFVSSKCPLRLDENKKHFEGENEE